MQDTLGGAPVATVVTKLITCWIRLVIVLKACLGQKAWQTGLAGPGWPNT